MAEDSIQRWLIEAMRLVERLLGLGTRASDHRKPSCLSWVPASAGKTEGTVEPDQTDTPLGNHDASDPAARLAAIHAEIGKKALRLQLPIQTGIHAF